MPSSSADGQAGNRGRDEAGQTTVKMGVMVPAENLLRRIQFECDPIKLGQALAYLSGGIHDLTKLKAAKLLYFADKLHLTR